MATITPGSGSTITASTIESFFCGAVWLLQSLEADTVRNPTGINNVISSTSDDSRSATGTITIRATVTDDSNGNMVLSPSDYLTTPSGGTVHWSPGSGGTITSSTIQGAIFEAARLIDSLENQPIKNPEGLKTIAYTITNGNTENTGLAEIQISFTSFPLTFTFNADGTQSLKGRSYLTI